jgi:hypothetical protein
VARNTVQAAELKGRRGAEWDGSMGDGRCYGVGLKEEAEAGADQTGVICSLRNRRNSN